MKAIADDVAGDTRACIVVADFAQMEGFTSVGDAAFQFALDALATDSHISARLMVAMHAARRGEADKVADLLDGYLAEDHDHHALRSLARAFVNDSPIRARAIRFFQRLAPEIRSLEFYVHAESLLHYNRGALKEAEACLRNAITLGNDLTNYLTLFSTLRRLDRRAEVRPILESLDPGALKGTPGQKMYLAQAMFSEGLQKPALAFAYVVLQTARNDPDAALRYFGLMMLDPKGRHTPRPRIAGLDCWLRLEGSRGESTQFVIEEGTDRPADGFLSPSHPIAAATIGLKVGESFVIQAAFGDDTTWRVAEIKHKYVHALHDVMGNFQTRFPDAKGFYTLKMKEGNVQPALEQIRRVAESNRELADLYLLQHLPMTMVASRLGRDAIGFADYIRSLDHDIAACTGTAQERDGARDAIQQWNASGAILDTYAAWTVATMDAFDVLIAVFGKLVIPRSCIDELQRLRDRELFAELGPSMTIGWHDGHYVRQEHTPEDLEARQTFIAAQIQKIEDNCEIVPVAAPDTPSELASMLTDAFGSDVLDAAYVAGEGYVLLSEDIYFRQMAAAAVNAEIVSVWLQPVATFAYKSALIDAARHADIAVKLAWRRHSHVSIDAEILWTVLQTDASSDLSSYRATSAYIGTQNADLRSHLTVTLGFLDRIWARERAPDLKEMGATGILLEQLTRFRRDDWASVLAILKRTVPSDLRRYIDHWVAGHFLSLAKLCDAERELATMRAVRDIRGRAKSRERK
jgi:tetratricopeptide (TPR) repeat protein